MKQMSQLRCNWRVKQGPGNVGMLLSILDSSKREVICTDLYQKKNSSDCNALDGLWGQMYLTEQNCKQEDQLEGSVEV